MTADPSALRAHLRDVRRQIEPARRRVAADAVVAQVRALPEWSGAGRVAVYRATDGELDPAAIADAARADGKTTYLPVLAGDLLRFAAFDDTTAWVRNRYGIDEPADRDSVDADLMDLVIVPAVAVDRTGHRLGMGAGWYDRTFASHLGARRTSGPSLVALVYAEQIVTGLEPQAWDVPMDAVVTPTATLRPRP
ncbi:MAG: 5-formyltetrahydrofolate cyclo-ligase [Acidimicrobiales bacterium]